MDTDSEKKKPLETATTVQEPAAPQDSRRGYWPSDVPRVEADGDAHETGSLPHPRSDGAPLPGEPNRDINADPGTG